MKKVLGLIFIIVIFGSCSVGNVSAQSTNDTQRIVGTWVSVLNGVTFTYIFNANGTFVLTILAYGDTTREEGNYFVSNSKIFTNTSGNRANVDDYGISADGKSLVLYYGVERREIIWLNKQ